mmetsp:Transcript_22001/g.70250  ORF Transcript_22001/g.70250 Transcript_22001/m.70250 type:complete len:185 (-) Transcript_22001:407-961(-)
MVSHRKRPARGTSPWTTCCDCDGVAHQTECERDGDKEEEEEERGRERHSAVDRNKPARESCWAHHYTDTHFLSFHQTLPPRVGQHGHKGAATLRALSATVATQVREKEVSQVRDILARHGAHLELIALTMLSRSADSLQPRSELSSFLLASNNLKVGIAEIPWACATSRAESTFTLANSTSLGL